MILYRQLNSENSTEVDLCSMPFSDNPSGLPPNFENPPSLQSTFITISAIMLAFAIIVAAGRLYTNKNAFSLADYFTVAGLILDLAAAGVLFPISRTLRHTWDIPICWLDATHFKLEFAESLTVGPMLFFSKAAIFLFYLQVFSAKRLVRTSSKIGIAMSFLAYIPTALALCYFESPSIGQSWEGLLDTPSKTNKGLIIGVANGVASTLVDIYVFVLPLPTILSLRIGFSKRIQLLALFATALMGVVASLVCLAYRIEALHLNDEEWKLGQIYITIVVENNVAIIVGSMPGFAKFLRIYVSESAFYKSLRTKLSNGSNSHVLDLEWKGSWQNRTLWTYGSPQRRQVKGHELSDSAIPLSQITAPEEALTATHATDRGIFRTVEFSQEVHTQRSLDRLC